MCQNLKICTKQKAIVGYSHLDDDSAGRDPTKMAEHMDAHGLLLEMQAEMQALSDPAVTNIGVGFAEDSTKVLVVELLSHSPLIVSSMKPGEDGSVQVEGLNLDPTNAGLYAARLVSSADAKKVVSLIGPQHIAFDKATAKWSMHFEPPGEEVFYASDEKCLEVFIRRKQIDTIPYGQPSTEKIKVEHLEQVIRLPVEYMPDPRVVKEDAHDAEAYERDAKDRLERQEEERLIRVAQMAAKKEEQAKKREAMLAEREKKKDGDDDSGSDEESGSQQSGSGSKSGVSGTKSSKKQSKSGSLGQSASKGKSFGAGSNDSESDNLDD